MSDTPKIFTQPWQDYELIDAGGGKKLERWGKIMTIRPEVQAYFRSGKPFDEWRQMAHWEFVQKGAQSGQWKQLKKAPDSWTICYDDLTFELRLTKFKHLGLFPEQRANWDLIKERLTGEGKFLNLFAYTGAASLMARNVGAETLHVDSVKQLISWARSNMEQSGLLDMKWVLEDALKFSARELKRGNKYQGIIMDPPAWGIGAKKEKWKLENKLDELLGKEMCALHFENRTHQVSELWMETTTGKKMYFGNMLRVG